MDIWVELISQLGFPIALVIAMAFFIWTIYKQSVVREEKLNEQLAKNQEVIKEAVETLAVYNQRLGNIESDVKTIKENIIGE